MPYDLLEELKQTITKPHYKLYRGLSFHDISEFYKHVEHDKYYKVGDTFKVYLKHLSSWSENFRTAASFSQCTGSDWQKNGKLKLEDMLDNAIPKKQYGILLKVKVDASNVLMDITYSSEEEVVLLPSIYSVKIMRLCKNGKKVDSMKEWDRIGDIDTVEKVSNLKK